MHLFINGEKIPRDLDEGDRALFESGLKMLKEAKFHKSEYERLEADAKPMLKVAMEANEFEKVNNPDFGSAIHRENTTTSFDHKGFIEDLLGDPVLSNVKDLLSIIEKYRKKRYNEKKKMIVSYYAPRKKKGGK